MLILLIISIVSALLLGTTKIDIFNAITSALNGDKSNYSYKILMHLRLPRVLGAVFSGAALAVSGLIIQAVLNNPMASPNIIGVNSGAGLFVILISAMAPELYSLLPAAAFTGALFACLLIYIISYFTDSNKMTITLVGIAINSILSAGISTVKTIYPNSVYDSNTFMIGGLAGVSYSKINYAALIISISLIITFIFSKDIDILYLGDIKAKSLGMRTSLKRFLFIILASALAGSAVSFAGLISFVGLIIPHIFKRIFGNSHRILLPLSAIGGATLVVICDVLARILFSPYEVPVGIILSFTGGPFFIFLIFMQRRKQKI